MSFFKAFNKVIQGKPVFEPGPNQTLPPHGVVPQPPAVPPAAHHGMKVLPRVFIEETTCHSNGARMDCHGLIRNDSAQPMELDKVRVLGATRELDTTLRPGERRQFLLYSGNRPQNTHNHECEVQYKDMTGDYFCGLHDVQLHKQPDNTYLIEHIRYQRIRDI